MVRERGKKGWRAGKEEGREGGREDLPSAEP